jgi:phage shock protein A
MLNQIIVDMRDQLSGAKREVAAAIADERKLRVQVEEEVKQARAWEKRAMLAVQESRDDLAKQALLRQSEHAERAGSLKNTWQVQATETEKLKASLRELNERIEEAKRKRNLLIAKQKRAQAQKRIHETLAGMSDTSAFDAFNRMAERIEDEERRTLAASEVTQALSGDTLEKEFTLLEGSDDADERLLALKREMGLLGPGNGEPRQLHAGTARDDASEEEKRSEGDSQIQEAELLEEFDRLEQRDALP